jgi:hypothetical protein
MRTWDGRRIVNQLLEVLIESYSYLHLSNCMSPITQLIQLKSCQTGYAGIVRAKMCFSHAPPVTEGK